MTKGKGVLLGSTSERVLRQSLKPVLVVPMNAVDEEDS